MEVYINCEDCNDSLEIIKEWTDWNGMNLTVRGCNSLLKLLGECYQVIQSECKYADEFLEEIDNELVRHGGEEYKHFRE